jgi:hypothetical protein
MHAQNRRSTFGDDAVVGRDYGSLASDSVAVRIAGLRVRPHIAWRRW